MGHPPGALSSQPAKADAYLFDFHFDPTTSEQGVPVPATDIVYSAASLEPLALYTETLLYVTGSVNGFTTDTLVPTLLGGGDRPYVGWDSEFVPPSGDRSFVDNFEFAVYLPTSVGTFDTEGEFGAGRTVARPDGGYQNVFNSGELIVTQVTPEPAPWALLGTGLVGLGAMVRRRQTLQG